MYRTPADLAAIIPIFPLPEAIVLPRARLPLNIFEPRYLAMVDAALKGPRLIGMIQPSETAGRNGLYPVGCAGRLTQVSETQDGRYLITLTGICRFRISEELTATTPYRQIHADYTPYADDLHPDETVEIDRPRLAAALGSYLHAQRMEADAQMVERAPAELLINSLAMICPFSVTEKQALLEAPTVAERSSALLMLLEMAAAGQSGGSQSMQ